MQLRSDKNKKAEDIAKELKAFIERFSANLSKSKQAIPGNMEICWDSREK
jgi:hypothetical protein